MIKTEIKRGQVWKQKEHDLYVEIIQKKDIHWKARILTRKQGVYAGSHSFHPRTLWKKYELIS